MSTLYVTSEEKELFQALPDSVTSAWDGDIEVETLESYESSSELIVRMRLVTSDGHPEVREFVFNTLEKLQNGGELHANVLDDVPSESLPVVFFGIGAIGLAAIIEMTLHKVQDADDLDGLAALSLVRHIILQTNASVTIA